MKKNISILLIVIMMVSILGACSQEESGKEEKNVDIEEIHVKVKEELGRYYIPDTNLSKEVLENRTDLDKDNIDEFIAEEPMISTKADTFIAIKAKDDKADDVEEDLEEYRQYLNEESVKYPRSFAKIKAAKVIRHGNYVFFIILGRPSGIADKESDEALDFAENEIKGIEEVIDNFFK
ncbi:MAG: DUF4358 domain-containing protein [Tissierella sp.]|uniref:DUF4358 domain-containing protein n=1 Tax=Tissierella sp. TaxID=41274 RepID=UPI003F9D6AD1